MVKNTTPAPNSDSDRMNREYVLLAAPQSQRTTARSGATMGSSTANGTMTARAVRSTRARLAPSPRRSPVLPCEESSGSIAVASETVTTACGTITIRNVCA